MNCRYCGVNSDYFGCFCVDPVLVGKPLTTAQAEELLALWNRPRPLVFVPAGFVPQCVDEFDNWKPGRDVA